MSFLLNPYAFIAPGGGDPSGIASIWDWWEPEREGF
jgi:hypothetical protein